MTYRTPFHPHAFDPFPPPNTSLAIPDTGEHYWSEASDHEDHGTHHHEKYRRNSDSSISSYNDMDQYPITGSWYTGVIRESSFTRPKLPSRGVVVTEKFKKPDITVHGIPSDTDVVSRAGGVKQVGEAGQTVAFAHFPKFSNQVRIGLGDPAISAGVHFIDVENPSILSHDEYRMIFNGRLITWQRNQATGSDGVEGGSLVRMINRNSYQLIDVNNHEVLAVFLANKFEAKKKGKLRIFRAFEGGEVERREFELLMVLSIASIVEKARRRAQRRRSVAAASAG